jgi:hypothetical protein
MKVKYSDGPAAVLLDAAGREVKRGEAVEVPPETGKQLLAQGWVEVKSPSHPPKAATASTKEKN